MPQPIPPPEPKPAFLRLRVKELQVLLSSPGFVLLALALAASPGLVSVLMPRQQPVQAPVQDTAPAWAVDVRQTALASIGQAVLAGLPAPVDGQRLPPCDQDLEREIRGACWVPVDVDRCPKGKAYVNDDGPRPDGKCYARAMRAARTPTSGEPQRANIAGP